MTREEPERPPRLSGCSGRSRDQQAATAEILSAIAASPRDLQRVLDTIARNAARVCDGVYAVVFRVDGTQIQLAAITTVSREARYFPSAIPQTPRR